MTLRSPFLWRSLRPCLSCSPKKGYVRPVELATSVEGSHGATVTKVETVASRNGGLPACQPAQPADDGAHDKHADWLHCRSTPNPSTSVKHTAAQAAAYSEDVKHDMPRSNSSDDCILRTV
ncbi:hypothetical protein F503_04162 [Ophiostoma piceae UAMH 11346]|uniref:Uncharacterized protein n=1 Tax=Ophiostoma piceae (strain UAMH 11346) TaxID=1262450 RepID=S3D587_OPHP1|nr:hypothetical protein F503_04162 [Ophiostoma piceae UAMH 11346]